MIDLPILTKNLRADILKMVYAANRGSFSHSFAIIDIIATLYFGEYIACNPTHPTWENRDYLVYGVAETAPALYTVLGEIGFFPKEEYFLYCQPSGILQEECSSRVPGVEITSHHTKQTISVASGLAIGLLNLKKKNKVFCVIGEEDINHPTFFYALEKIAEYHLNNLVIIIEIQSMANVRETENLQKICTDLSLNILIIDDAHDFDMLQQTFEKALKNPDSPSILFAYTKKGKGVSFIENNPAWDTKIPTEEEFHRAMEQLVS